MIEFLQNQMAWIDMYPFMSDHLEVSLNGVPLNHPLLYFSFEFSMIKHPFGDPPFMDPPNRYFVKSNDRSWMKLVKSY